MLLVAVVGWAAFLLILHPFRKRTKTLERIANSESDASMVAYRCLYETSFIWDEDDDIARADRT